MRLKRLQSSLDPAAQKLVPLLDTIGVKSTDQVVHTRSTRLFGLLRQAARHAKDAQGNDNDDQDGVTVTIEEAWESLLEACLQEELEGGKPLNAMSILDLAGGSSSGEDAESGSTPAGFGFGLESLDDLLMGFFKEYSQGGVVEIAGTKSSGRTVSIVRSLH
jgi:hypothetical protein